MKQAVNHLIDQIIQSSHQALNANKPRVDHLVSCLCNATKIDLHPDFFVDENATRTPKGKAVSMTTAAQCAEEFLRTQVFIRGVHQAIEDQLAQHQKVNLLYGGTGPFGLLVLPLLHRFSTQELQITLLDIHQESLDRLDLIIQALDVSDYIKTIQCTDILKWDVPIKEYDIVVSETMMAMLMNEPQVSIFRHLIPALKDTGCLVPQQVVLDTWLIPNSKDAQPQHIGNVFTLSRDTAKALSQQEVPHIESSFTIPFYEGHSADLRHTTHIQAYGEHWLTDNQCSLNLPFTMANANPEPNATLTATYHFTDFPCFSFDYPKHKNHIKENSLLPDLLDTNALALPYLKRLWHRVQADKRGHKKATQAKKEEWALSLKCFDILQLGLEPTMQALYSSATEKDFTDYILQQNQGTISEEQRDTLEKCVHHCINANTQIEGPIDSVLTQEQWQCWEANGYVIIPNVLNSAECQQLTTEICQFMGVALDSPDTWYRPSVPMQQIMVPLFNSPMQKAIRNKTHIHKVFNQLWQNNDLIVSTDRASFNPPQTNDFPYQGTGIHLDVALTTPVPFGTQGMIYLTDTSEKQGAFCCIPKFHHQFDQWRQTSLAKQNLQDQDWSHYDIKPIAAKAGDLIIWHHALPHGSSPNHETQPRIVQYLNMQPAH